LADSGADFREGAETAQSWLHDPDPRAVGEGVGRFLDPRDGGRPPQPTPAMLRELPDVGPLPAEARARPLFSRRSDASGEHREIRIPTTPGTSLYGTGEVAGRLLRNGELTVCWTTDASDYDDESPSLYQAHPWVLAVRPDGTSFGVLADTPSRVEIDLTTDIRFCIPAEVAPFAVYVIESDTPQGVVMMLAELTGRIGMPPRWALGYHQSRWSYDTQDWALNVAREFRERRIPCDCIWLDIDYMDGFRCFTFDPTMFPDPAALNLQLHELGFRSVWMIDPGIKVDENYWVYRRGREDGHFVAWPDGSEYHGTVWPGPCAFPDFTSARTRHWWAGLYADFLATGIDGVWNDMNEPAVFDNPQKQPPEDLLHRADPDLGGHGEHRRYHNIYGMQMVRATLQGIRAARPDQRPFLLTRSNFIGGQRYAATWTGDNTSDWNHLAWSIPMILNLALSGQPFSGPDIGGFGGDCDGRLFARWMGIGALLPFARGHTIKHSGPHEPWAFGPEIEATCLRALERRYRLLPYLYTLFHDAAETGSPIVRPLFFADPTDADLRAADDSFLLGPDILVRAVVTPHGGCRAPLPPGDWRPWEPCPRPDGTADPELPQLLFRAGSIVPLGQIIQHTGEAPLDPLTLLVTPGPGGARGVLYEDDGDGWEYLSGHFTLSTYRCEQKGHRLELTLADRRGRRPHGHRPVEAVCVLEDGSIRNVAGREGDPLHLA
jgi:alpha-glucosidase